MKLKGLANDVEYYLKFQYVTLSFYSFSLCLLFPFTLNITIKLSLASTCNESTPHIMNMNSGRDKSLNVEAIIKSAFSSTNDCLRQ